MNRITPEIALKAYLDQDMIPIREEWCEIRDGRKCGCGLTAVYASRVENGFADVEQAEHPTSLLREGLELSGSYIRGFIAGFDGEDLSTIDGYEDGRAAWEAVKHLAAAESAS
jgi:hypothetical protein